MCLCFCSQRLSHSSGLAGQLCVHCSWCRINSYISKALDSAHLHDVSCCSSYWNWDTHEEFLKRRKVTSLGTVWFLMVMCLCILQSGFLPYYYEVPHNMGSVLVKETRVVALDIFGHKVRVSMQDVGMISTALVFIVQMFLCLVVEAHPGVEYITLKMFLRTSVIVR